MPEYQKSDFECVMADIWQCVNCGAHASAIDKIAHFAGCEPGEAAKWEKFYEYAEEEDDEWED